MRKSSVAIFVLVTAAVVALGKCSAGKSPSQQQADTEASLRYAELKAAREARRAGSAEQEQALLQLRDLAIADDALTRCLERAVSYALNHTGSRAIAGPTELTELECKHQSIRRLDGIEAFTQLQSLDLSGNKIEDVSPLGKLHGLQKLDLSYNPVKSIWALQSLDRLEHLNLKEAPVTDLNFLSGFDSLRHVEFRLTPNERCDYLADIQRALKHSRAKLSIPRQCVDEFGEPARLSDFE